jgi:hypothetical protein
MARSLALGPARRLMSTVVRASPAPGRGVRTSSSSTFLGHRSSATGAAGPSASIGHPAPHPHVGRVDVAVADVAELLDRGPGRDGEDDRGPLARPLPQRRVPLGRRRPVRVSRFGVGSGVAVGGEVSEAGAAAGSVRRGHGCGRRRPRRRGVVVRGGSRRRDRLGTGVGDALAVGEGSAEATVAVRIGRGPACGVSGHGWRLGTVCGIGAQDGLGRGGRCCLGGGVGGWSRGGCGDAIPGELGATPVAGDCSRPPTGPVALPSVPEASEVATSAGGLGAAGTVGGGRRAAWAGPACLSTASAAPSTQPEPPPARTG